jgi:hypothetical protein
MISTHNKKKILDKRIGCFFLAFFVLYFPTSGLEFYKKNRKSRSKLLMVYFHHFQSFLFRNVGFKKSENPLKGTVPRKSA